MRFGGKDGVTYNPLKTVCMCISHRGEAIQSNITLSGETVKWVSTMKHLGNIIRCGDLKEIDDITRKTGDFIDHV